MKGTREEEEIFFLLFLRIVRSSVVSIIFTAFGEFFSKLRAGSFFSRTREYSIWRVKMSRVTNSSRLESKYINK